MFSKVLKNCANLSSGHMAIVVKDEMTVTHLEKFEEMHRSFKKTTDLMPVPPPVSLFPFPCHFRVCGLSNVAAT